MELQSRAFKINIQANQGNVMKTLTLLALILSSSAFAGEYVSRKLTFSPITILPNSTVLYNCNFLEDATESMLKDLGAINVRVRCLRSVQPLVKATFEVPAESTGAVETVSFKGKNSCGFYTAFFKNVAPLLPAAKLVKSSSRCSGGSRLDFWSYKFEVSK